MHGNVAEMVVDTYADDWYKTLKEKGGVVKFADAINWPEKQYPRLARGGDYESDAEDLRSAARRELKTNVNVKDPQLPRSPHWYSNGFGVGLRLVSPAKTPSVEEQHKFWGDPPDSGTAKILEARKERQIREIVEPSAAEKK
jgi:hypothetical protein